MNWHTSSCGFGFLLFAVYAVFLGDRHGEGLAVDFLEVLMW